MIWFFLVIVHLWLNLSDKNKVNEVKKETIHMFAFLD